jgi:TP901 family phage tail tape measure protein
MDRNLRIRMLLEAGDRVSRPLREIAGGSAKAARELRATRDRLRDLDRAQADINGFRELKTGLRSTEAEMTQAQARVAALARQMAATDTPTKKLAAEFARAKRESATLKSEFTEQSARLQQLRDRLGAAGVATGNLGQHERRLRGDISRTNEELQEQERRLRTAADRAQRFGAAREKFGRGMNMATGLAAGGFSAMQTGQTMAQPIKGAVSDAMEFESVMTDIAQKADMSREAAARMGDRLMKVADRANLLPEAIQQGMETLTGMGFTPAQAEGMIAPISRASTAYKAEMADLSAATFAASDNLKVPIAQTAKVLDVMATAGKRGAFEMKDMASYFPTLTAASQALGQKGVPAVADLAAALQIARKGAGSSEAAATNIGNVLQKINAPATVRAFKKNYGVDLPAALKKLYAEGKTPLEAIAELTNKVLKGDLSKIGYLFEDAQVQAGLRPLIQNMEEYRKIREDAMSAGGTVDTDFAERMRDASEQTKAYNTGAKQLSITFGTLLLPAAIRVMGAINRTGKGFMAWAKTNPGFAKGLGYVAAILAGLFIVLGGGAIVIAGLVAPFFALGAAATFLGIGMLPLVGIGILPLVGIALAVMAAIGLIAGAAYLIYANWGSITGFFAGIGEGIKSAIMGAVQYIAIGASSIAALASLFANAGRALLMGLVNGIMGALGWVKSAIGNVGASVIGWFKAKLGIHSPSRVFAGLGGFMMEGLTQGIDRGSGAPVRRIAGLSAALVAGMSAPSIAPTVALSGEVASVIAPATPTRGAGAPAAQGRAGSAVGQGDVITIQVFATKEQRPSDIAEEVRRVLAAERRREASNRNASFADFPDWDDRA